MAYVSVLGTTDTLLSKVRAARTQLLYMHNILRSVQKLEARADVEDPGYDPWPIDDDANALQMASCAAMYNNVLASLGDGTLQNWRYGYLIKLGRPPALTSFSVSDFAPGSYIIGNAGDAFGEVYGDPTHGDQIAVRWKNSNDVDREVSGLIVSVATANTIRTTLPINPENIVNGAFASAASWTWDAGAGVTHDAGTLKANFNAATGTLSQVIITLTVGAVYTLTYTMSGYSAGELQANLTGLVTQVGTNRTADGTYTDTFIADNPTATLTFRRGTGVALTTKLDNVILREVIPSGDSIEIELEAVWV